MIAAVLGRRWRVLKTTGNENNEIGLPKTLLQLGPEHGAAVLEMALARLEELPAAAELTAGTVDEAVDKARALINEWKKSCKEADIPPKRLFRTLRIALTGRGSGPELPFMLAGLGRDTIRERLEAARPYAK